MRCCYCIWAVFFFFFFASISWSRVLFFCLSEREHCTRAFSKYLVNCLRLLNLLQAFYFRCSFLQGGLVGLAACGFFYAFFFNHIHLSCVSSCWVGSRPIFGGSGEGYWTSRLAGIFFDAGVVRRLTDEHQAQRYKLRRGIVVDLACMEAVFGSFVREGRLLLCLLLLLAYAYIPLYSQHMFTNACSRFLFTFSLFSLLPLCEDYVQGRVEGMGFNVDAYIRWKTLLDGVVLCGGNKRHRRDTRGKDNRRLI